MNESPRPGSRPRKLVRHLGLLILLGLFGLGIAGTARAAEIAPIEVSLSADPAAIDWPAVTETKLWMTVKSGPEGADFRFDAMPEGWGVKGAVGNPIYVDRAKLDGPGTLSSEGAVIADLMPGTCLRGGFQGTHETFRLLLPPDSETIVGFPVRALAAPLSGMTSAVRTRILVGSDSDSYRTEIPFGGKQGIQINFEITDEKLYKGAVRTDAPFRLTGRTIPAVPGLRINFIAYPQRKAGGPILATRQLTTLVTDGEGRFRSSPVMIQDESRWLLTGSPASGGVYDDGASCGPVVDTKTTSRIAYRSDLVGSAFRSIRISGTRLVGQKKIRLEFTLKDGGRVKTKQGSRLRLLHVLTGRAGCNTMSGRYWINDGLLRWSKKLARTKKRCGKPVDTWLAKNLQRGMKARIEQDRLVLRGRQGLQIVLKRLPG